jgi:hypothetical protein
MKTAIFPMLVLAATAAQGAIVIRPVSVVSVTGAGTLFTADNLINNSGLSTPLNSGDTLVTASHQWKVDPSVDSWVSTDPGGYPSDWFAASGTQPTFVLDLGADVAITDIHLWAYGGSAGAGTQGNTAKDLTFRFNTNAQGSGAFSGTVYGAQMDHGPDTSAASGFVLPRQDFTLGATVTARFVQMTITDNWFVAPGNGSGLDTHGHAMDGGDRVGLGEVRFSNIPEPATMTLGAVGILAILRRRRQ